MKPKFSLCASAIRTQCWQKTVDSLKNNKIEWEIVYVGNVRPNFSLPSNFKFIYATVKPAQCYEIAFRNAQGELICWTADDAYYSPNALDIVYDFYKKFNNEKNVIGFRTIEDGKDITDVHRFFGKNYNSPRMSPFGVVNRELFHKLGGYDRRFICGQSENDVVMRFYEIGGDVKISEAKAIVEHRNAHHKGTVFRTNYYWHDRKILEGCWVKNGVIQKKRLDKVQSYDDTNITTITQSYRGQW
jgi:hypothetical protein